MALVLRSLALAGSVPSGNTRGYTGWHRYSTPDAVATVIAAGYFNNARAKLAVNDVIDCMCVNAGVGDRVSVNVTAVPASGDVTVAVNTDATAA